MSDISGDAPTKVGGGNVVDLTYRRLLRTPGYIEAEKAYQAWLVLLGGSPDRVATALTTIGAVAQFLAAHGVTVEEVAQLVVDEMAQQERLEDLASDYGR